jgi:hypothetical protein
MHKATGLNKSKYGVEVERLPVKVPQRRLVCRIY